MALKIYKVEDVPMAVQAAIDAKDVAMSADEVEISEKASKSGKGGKRSYFRLEALTGKGMQALCGKIVPATAKPKDGKDERTDDEKLPGACDYFNYGYDLDVRASVRADLATELEGPEKALAKMAKSLIDGGLMSRTEAIEFVIGKAKEQGKDVVSAEQLGKALAA